MSSTSIMTPYYRIRTGLYSYILSPISRNALDRFSRNFQGLWGHGWDPHTKFCGNLSIQFWGKGKVKTLTPVTPPKWDWGPQFFSLGVSPPHQCAKFQTFAPRGWGGRIFENSQTCKLELENQNGAG